MQPGNLRRNLRHLRLMRVISDCGSLSGAAAISGLSQTAVTHALRAMEQAAGGPLFDRGAFGARVTARGALLLRRLGRGLDRLDPALDALASGLARVTTMAQLHALIAVAEAGSGALAARRLGLAQPSVQRAVTDLEKAAGSALFERRAEGLRATRVCEGLVREVRLALAELDQAEAEMAELSGQVGGRVVIGALALARTVVLPGALAAFRAEWPETPVTVRDGTYDALLTGLMNGQVDFIIGALRDPPPVAGLHQEALFRDRLCLVARRGHPVLDGTAVTPQRLAQQSWLVPLQGSPSRQQFDAYFAAKGVAAPKGLVETSSILLMREVLESSDMLGCISGGQAGAELRRGLLEAVPVDGTWPQRDIGLTMRRDWEPTRAQARMLAFLRASREVTDCEKDQQSL